MTKRVRRTVKESQENILSAAEGLVRESGPAGLTLTEVARRAKTTHPNIIARFGSALELQRQTASRIATAIIAEIAEDLTDATETSEPLRQSLHTLFERLAEEPNRRIFAWIILHDEAGRIAGLDAGLGRIVDLLERRVRTRDNLEKVDREYIGLLMRLAIGAALGNGLAGRHLEGLADTGEGGDRLADIMADMINVILDQRVSRTPAY
ncbi:TetR/AcrR family transcriptional regulator [Parasphingopyxis algicola]|uniref:TetR/AcrR family transcriptional regulator n=1 Tax=Parasphingopyxis algicola TaxID=2026624 RepID=UPI0015A475BA|nr:TetR/AcrR family transcriptional regulator [Parasphingopyxis algicola]QLC24941.1 TetR/AcrR family transcriptional regulator [Parasphingopyxis algicola]